MLWRKDKAVKTHTFPHIHEHYTIHIPTYPYQHAHARTCACQQTLRLRQRNYSSYGARMDQLGFACTSAWLAQIWCSAKSSGSTYVPSCLQEGGHTASKRRVRGTCQSLWSWFSVLCLDGFQQLDPNCFAPPKLNGMFCDNATCRKMANFLYGHVIKCMHVVGKPKHGFVCAWGGPLCNNGRKVDSNSQQDVSIWQRDNMAASDFRCALCLSKSPIFWRGENGFVDKSCWGMTLDFRRSGLTCEFQSSFEHHVPHNKALHDKHISVSFADVQFITPSVCFAAAKSFNQISRADAGC